MKKAALMVMAFALALPCASAAQGDDFKLGIGGGMIHAWVEGASETDLMGRVDFELLFDESLGFRVTAGAWFITEDFDFWHVPITAGVNVRMPEQNVCIYVGGGGGVYILSAFSDFSNTDYGLNFFGGVEVEMFFFEACYHRLVDDESNIIEILGGVRF